MNALYTSKEHSLHSSTMQMFVRFESNSAEVNCEDVHCCKNSIELKPELLMSC